MVQRWTCYLHRTHVRVVITGPPRGLAHCYLPGNVLPCSSQAPSPRHIVRLIHVESRGSFSRSPADQIAASRLRSAATDNYPHCQRLRRRPPCRACPMKTSSFCLEHCPPAGTSYRTSHDISTRHNIHNSHSWHAAQSVGGAQSHMGQKSRKSLDEIVGRGARSCDTRPLRISERHRRKIPTR